jgi:hypothetical protein
MLPREPLPACDAESAWGRGMRGVRASKCWVQSSLRTAGIETETEEDGSMRTSPRLLSVRFADEQRRCLYLTYGGLISVLRLFQLLHSWARQCDCYESSQAAAVRASSSSSYSC